MPSSSGNGNPGPSVCFLSEGNISQAVLGARPTVDIRDCAGRRGTVVTARGAHAGGWLASWIGRQPDGSGCPGGTLGTALVAHGAGADVDV